MKVKKITVLFLLVLFFVCACSSDPDDRKIDPVQKNGVLSIVIKVPESSCKKYIDFTLNGTTEQYNIPETTETDGNRILKISKVLDAGTYSVSFIAHDEFDHKIGDKKSDSYEVIKNRTTTGEYQLLTESGKPVLSDNSPVIITCTDLNAVVYYTTDGSKPNKNSTTYTDAIVLDEAILMVHAFSSVAGKDDSVIASKLYNNTKPEHEHEHTWDGGVITKEPDCEESGIKKYTCTNPECGVSYEEILPMTGHTYSSEWSYDEYVHYHQATCKHKNLRADEHEHDFKIIEHKDPTESSDGYEIKECTVCGYSCKETFNWPTIAKKDSWFKGTFDKSEVKEIIFSQNGPEENFEQRWYCGATDDDLITVYAIEKDSMYTLYIVPDYADKIKTSADCSSMFCDFSSLTKITGLDMLKTNCATSMMYMFANCYELESIDLSGFDTSNVKTIRSMFRCCSRIKTIDVSCLNTSKVTSMWSMFEGCSSLKSMDISSFNTSCVTTMYRMFNADRSLEDVKLGLLDISNLKDCEEMFQGCNSLVTIFSKSSWKNASVTDSALMFKGCVKLEGGNGTTYNASYSNISRACIDTQSTPGYFTLQE